MVPGDPTSASSFVQPSEDMVCAIDESTCTCVVRDLINTSWSTGKITLTLSYQATIEVLLQKISQKMHYKIDTFETTLQRPGDNESIVLNNLKNYSLESVGFSCTAMARNSLIVTQLKNVALVKMDSTEDPSSDDLSLGASASPTASGDGAINYMAPLAPMTTASDYNYPSSYIHNESTGHVGLVNQAMTCYLNSLLQALFMTPEFRNALYRWEFDNQEEGVHSIPYQLQKLFLQLQTSEKQAVETTELTRSFGWDSGEAWQQHDIQELCRVMFDALEQKFKNTDQSDLISRLYEGKMIDYVKCLECKTEKQREDTFLDIPLPVRPFGSTTAYGSVEEALRAFVQPEVLDGNNQYFCEKCDKKCDAHKGLKFSKYPYILTIHLKRFDFDYTTLHRIKLNDKVTFPETLNLNGFISEGKDERENEEVTKYDDSSTTDSGSALDDESCHGTESTVNTQDTESQEDDEGIDMSNGPIHQENLRNRQHQNAVDAGPYIYELFSIMIHSGSASGGHYYAYIKDFKQGDWFCFNDQLVSQITYDDIRKTYGGGPTRGYYSGAYSSSTNAYMLMYRQIDDTRNSEPVTQDEFPSHIKGLLCQMQEKEEEDRVARERERNMCKVKVYYNHPDEKQLVEVKLRLLRDATLQEATEMAFRQLDIEDIAPLNRCRLVKYDRYHDVLESSFEGQEEDSISDILGGLKSSCKFDLLLESRDEDKEFEVYHPDGLSTKVYVINMQTEEVDEPKTLRAFFSNTVYEFKVLLAKILNTEPELLQLTLRKTVSELKLLSKDHSMLRVEGFLRSSKVFAQIVDPSSFCPYKFIQIVDRYEHTITLQVYLPPTDKETLERLGIPLLGCEPPEDTNYEPSVLTTIPQNYTYKTVRVQWASVSETTVNEPPPNNNLPESPKHTSDNEDEGILGDINDPTDNVTDNTDAITDPTDNTQGVFGHSSDQSASEDSSLTDSDRTLIGDARDDCLARVSSTSNSPQGSEDRNISSPETGSKDEPYKEEKDENWDDEPPGIIEDIPRKYFRASPCIDSETGKEALTVSLDKRITVNELKAELEPLVNVPRDYLKIYRKYTSNQEFECTWGNDTLSSLGDIDKLILKLGRALRKGEHRGKVYQLLPNDAEAIKFLCEWVIAKGMTVGEAKKEIIGEVKDKCGLDIPFNRCRLRRRSWKNPGPVYLDSQILGEDINFYSNWEMFLQVLDVPEYVKSLTQMVFFVKRWCPCMFVIGPMEEVLLEENTTDELKLRLSEISGIPVEDVEFAKGSGSFPSDISVLTIHTELDWNPQSLTLDAWPLFIHEDGHVFYYRNKQEILKVLSDEERREITNRENPRLGNLGRSTTTHSPRKERALKIYLDHTPPKDETLDTEVD